MMMLPLAAQEPTAPAAAPAAQQDSAPAQASATLSNEKTPRKAKKQKVTKEDRVVKSKDTRRVQKRDAKLNPLAGKDANLPDKALYDKALAQTKSGHFDVARLDLQTLLNTYPDSQYQMRAKLAIADSWYKEGGSAALTQAEQEYNDFITFFPNVPEAAEAQMRVGDIYFKQMDVPDRDYQKALKAQDAYRLMLKQYPDSPIIPEAHQKLREVQEVLAEREAELGAFYATHENWPATIARFQTVADTYPLYSHMDDVLIAIGDAYASESRLVRAQTNLPEGARAQLLATYDGRAAAAYRKVVLEHSAATHVEDAKERLVSMGLPVPNPTPEQAAASEALEGSRAQYNLQKRLAVMFMRRPDTVTAARTGEAPLDDATATVAPSINRQIMEDYRMALDPRAASGHPVISDANGTPTPATSDQPVPVPAAPLAFQDVAGPGEGSTGSGTSTMTGTSPSAATGARGNSVGVEVLTPGVKAPVVASPDRPPTGTAADTSYGLKTAAPADAAALPPVEKAAPAPDAVNEAEGKVQPPTPTPAANPNKKTPKPVFDKDDESSSKNKKKKGLGKLNPF